MLSRVASRGKLSGDEIRAFQKNGQEYNKVLLLEIAQAQFSNANVSNSAGTYTGSTIHMFVSSGIINITINVYTSLLFQDALFQRFKIDKQIFQNKFLFQSTCFVERGNGFLKTGNIHGIIQQGKYEAVLAKSQPILCNLSTEVFAETPPEKPVEKFADSFPFAEFNVLNVRNECVQEFPAPIGIGRRNCFELLMDGAELFSVCIFYEGTAAFFSGNAEGADECCAALSAGEPGCAVYEGRAAV